MIKVIHLIMLGERLNFSNLEMSCINSWKEIYPDWEIKIWRDKDCIDWINKSKFASYYYYNKAIQGMAYVSDYIRCKILYEYGGLYMDFDVFAVNRIPDYYFERPFTAWDVIGHSINNGTCMYAPASKLKIFDEFAEVMDEGSIQIERKDGADAANSRIEKVLERYGFVNNWQCETDVDLGDIVIYNRSQFGGRHEENDGYVTHGKEVFLVHACSGSWVMHSFYSYVEVLYTIVDNKTDMNLLKQRLEYAIEHRNRGNIVVLFLSKIIELDDEIKALLKKYNDLTRTFVLPVHGDARACALDYLVRRVKDIRVVKDFMRDV